MRNDYCTLSVSEFLDVISDAAARQVYSVVLPPKGMEMQDTLAGLSRAAIEYQNCDIGPGLADVVAAIRDYPIHQYSAPTLTDITDYADRRTNHYDQEMLRALYADTVRYYYNLPACEIKTIGAERVRYLKRFLASKIDGDLGANDGRPFSSAANRVELPAGLNTKLDHKQVALLFDWLKKGGYIDEDADCNSFTWALGGAPVDAYRPIVWLKTKQLLRELLVGVATDSKANIERRVHQLFVDQSGAPYVLAKNKQVPSAESDAIADFLATL